MPPQASPILSAVNLSGPSHTPPILPSLDSNPPSVVLNESGLVVEQTTDGEWTYDPNEPRYCICNQVSYGDMVACDNEAVRTQPNYYYSIILYTPLYGSIY